MSSSSKILTDDAWKAAARDVKVRDKDLRRALNEYQAGVKAEDASLKYQAIEKVASCAADLKRDRDVVDQPELVSHLSRLVAAARAEERVLAKQSKSAAAQDEEEDDDDGDGPGYSEKLAKSLEKLKSASKPYHFVVCVATPFCTLSIGKNRMTAKHLKEISEAAGGSRRFLKPGTCTRQGANLTFEMEDPPRGLSRKIQFAIRHFTGKKYIVTVGDETAGDEEGQDELGVAGEATGLGGGNDGGVESGRTALAPSLAKTPEVWNTTRRVVKSKVDLLKQAIRKTYAAEGADMLGAIEQSMRSLDRVFESLDDRLTKVLERAAASDGAARESELQNAKALLSEHLRYVKSEPMIAHIDENPFGVATNLQATLTKGLRHVVQALGGDRGR